MREENALIEEELQQKEIQTEQATEEQVQTIETQIVPEPETQPQEEMAEDVPEAQETSDEETVTEELPAQEEETPAEDTAVEEPAAQEEAPSEEGEEPLMPEVKKIPYHERFYLKYREGKRTTPLDLNGTRAFLNELGFDGGELRQAREGKNCAEGYRNIDQNKNNQMRCSYCGAEIAGVEFFRLPDGRMRCTTCSSTLVKTKEEVEAICQRVIANMDNFFGATIDVAVSVEVVDERKLKKKVGVPLGTRDSQSMLILGVAINKKKKYSIILENGAPRISLIATFAHELTHIWQYTHWDNKRDFPQCPKSKRLLIYEGMAKWAEIQYLYLIGETNIAKREEYITRNRQDEYGIGFCLYEDRYPLSREAMSCEDTPFTPDRYPFD